MMQIFPNMTDGDEDFDAGDDVEFRQSGLSYLRSHCSGQFYWCRKHDGGGDVGDSDGWL